MDSFQKALKVLDRVKEDLSHDAKDRAMEGLDEIKGLVLEAKKAGEDGGDGKKSLLASLAELAKAFAPFASLINTLIQIFQ